MNKKQTAVLVIDVQAGLFEPAPQPFEAQETVQRINALTARARAAGVPVGIVLHEREGSALAYQSEGWQPQAQLQVEPGDRLLRKITPDSFLRTELGDWLAAAGVSRLVICGYASEFCVDTTTRCAAAQGFEVDLVADGHTTHDKPHASAAQIRAHHNATLPGITSFGPRIRAVPGAEIEF